jgi:probable HAF family extracellular repeat protein
MYPTKATVCLAVVISIVCALSTLPVLAAATFTPIGIFPGGRFPVAQTNAVSADGNVVVGGGWSTIGAQPFRWTEADGMVGLGELPGGLNETGLAANGFFAKTVSSDGSVVVGSGGSSNGHEAYRWTQATGMVALGDLPGGTFFSTAVALSADGSTVVGNSRSSKGDEAYRWTQDTGMVGIGDLPGGDYFSDARDISADGSVVVGGSASTNGYQAYRWTEATGMVGLGKLPGHIESQASAISADGSFIAGISGGAVGPGGIYVVEAFRWTQEGGMLSLGGGAWEPHFVSPDGSVIIGHTYPLGPGDVQTARYWSQATGTIWLGTLPGGIRTIALGASADGSVVVGQVEFPNSDDNKAFYWTNATGMLDLRELLIAEGLTDLTDWKLHSAYGVSADGRTIVGNSENRPDADQMPWVARLSAPTLSGDFNDDGTVDAADYVVWRHGLGSAYTQTDYDIWRANFGQTAGNSPSLPSAESLSAAVPEPGGLLLVATALAAALRRSQFYKTRSKNCLARDAIIVAYE